MRKGIQLRGSTLVEVAVAMLILAVISIAITAYLYHSQQRLNIQRDRRAALELANSQLAYFVRGISYSTVTGMVGSVITSNVTLNGKSGFVMSTYVVDTGAGEDNCIGITVDINYRRGVNENISLRTLRYE